MDWVDGKQEPYTLQTDSSETKDVLSTHSKITAKMTKLANLYSANGRNTAGAAEKNDFNLSIPGEGTNGKRKK